MSRDNAAPMLLTAPPVVMDPRCHTTSWSENPEFGTRKRHLTR